MSKIVAIALLIFALAFLINALDGQPEFYENLGEHFDISAMNDGLEQLWEETK